MIGELVEHSAAFAALLIRFGFNMVRALAAVHTHFCSFAENARERPTTFNHTNAKRANKVNTHADCAMQTDGQPRRAEAGRTTLAARHDKHWQAAL